MTELKVQVPFSEIHNVNLELQKLQNKFSKADFYFNVYKNPCKMLYKNKELDGIDIKIVIQNPILQYKGYIYIATLKRELKNIENGNQIFSNLKEDFSEYFNINFRCDHCKTNRKRKIVHLFRNEEGKDLMIASSCSKEYFGINLGSKLDKILNVYNKQDSILNEFKLMSVQWKQNFFDTIYYANIVSSLLRKRKEYYKEVSTEALELYNLQAKITPTLNASKFYQYWEDKREINNFVHNVKTALRMLKPQAGLIAWAVWEYLDKVEDIKNEKIKIVNEWVGNIGQTIFFTAKILSKKDHVSDWGNSYIVKMLKSDGKVLTWFAGGKWYSIVNDWNIGDIFSGKARIKSHDEYRYEKYTTINYVKLY